jgi:hypothetical protein
MAAVLVVVTFRRKDHPNDFLHQASKPMRVCDRDACEFKASMTVVPGTLTIAHASMGHGGYTILVIAFKAEADSTLWDSDSIDRDVGAK